MNAFAVMSQFPERMRQFQLGCAYADAGFPVVGFYDFSKLAGSDDGDRVTLVDLGGGQGQVIAAMLQAFPQLNSKKMVSKTCQNL